MGRVRLVSRSMRTMLAGALLLSGAALAQTPTSVGPIDPNAIKEDVRTLSSDAFQGRGPGQRGETMTLAYLRAQFEAAGLQPGGPNGSWFQDVPLIRMDHRERSLALSVGGTALPLQQTRDFSVTGSHAGTASVTDAPLVFVGFGIHAPELGWDDYVGLDLRGKVAVMLPNDPDFDQPTGPFGGYARSRYASGKAAAAYAAGAVGVITIHRQALTSWPWQQIYNSDPDPTYRRAETQPPAGNTRLSAYITGETAAALFSRAGLDLEAMIRRAQQRGFRAVPLPGATLTASVTVTETPVTSHNVVARLEGTSRAGETVLMGAHWDGYGIGVADAAGDTIRNAAIDNGIGTATLLELARAFARAPRTQRSLIFVAYTAEEKGLLGAYEYAAHPARPLATTAAVFNIDPHLALSQTRSVELIGAGRTTLEADLTRLAAAQARTIEAEADPSAGWYGRSDHYAFAVAGVPTVYFRAGRDLVVGGRAEGVRQVGLYNSQCYHQRCDQFQEAWDMAAAAQDGALVYAMARELADSGRWPAWNAGSEFSAVRERSAAERR